MTNKVDITAIKGGQTAMDEFAAAESLLGLTQIMIGTLPHIIDGLFREINYQVPNVTSVHTGGADSKMGMAAMHVGEALRELKSAHLELADLIKDDVKLGRPSPQRLEAFARRLLEETTDDEGNSKMTFGR